MKLEMWWSGESWRYHTIPLPFSIPLILIPMQVQQKRWKVETYSRLDSVLQLSSVNLPGGVLRRRGIQDELMMRDYFREGDLISVSELKMNISITC